MMVIADGANVEIDIFMIVGGKLAVVAQYGDREKSAGANPKERVRVFFDGVNHYSALVIRDSHPKVKVGD